jgi:Uma2 family endonuclease
METIVPAQSEYETQRGKPKPSKNHAIVQSNLVFQLKLKYRPQYEILSEISLELNDWEATPDVAVYPKMKVNFLEDEVRLSEPPLCAIEILSPSQALSDLINKTDKYFKNGVRSCWLVLPMLKNVYVFSSFGFYRVFFANDTLQDDALGLELPLEEVFG